MIASPEKALIDAMFFVALGRGSLSVEELNLQSVDKAKVRQMASKITNKAFKNYFASTNSKFMISKAQINEFSKRLAIDEFNDHS